jgi:hypothetical protein
LRGFSLFFYSVTWLKTSIFNAILKGKPMK